MPRIHGRLELAPEVEVATPGPVTADARHHMARTGCGAAELDGHQVGPNSGSGGAPNESSR